MTPGSILMEILAMKYPEVEAIQALDPRLRGCEVEGIEVPNGYGPEESEDA